MPSRWGIPDLDTTEDPFAEVVRKRDPLIHLQDLIEQEARWVQDMGDCELKSRDWGHPACSTCNYRGSYGALCRIGMEQERVLLELELDRD